MCFVLVLMPNVIKEFRDSFLSPHPLTLKQRFCMLATHESSLPQFNGHHGQPIVRLCPPTCSPVRLLQTPTPAAHTTKPVPTLSPAYLTVDARHFKNTAAYDWISHTRRQNHHSLTLTLHLLPHLSPHQARCRGYLLTLSNHPPPTPRRSTRYLHH